MQSGLYTVQAIDENNKQYILDGNLNVIKGYCRALNLAIVRIRFVSNNFENKTLTVNHKVYLV